MELLKELFRFRRYKVNQGRLIRKLTMAGVWVMFATASWKCTLLDFTWFSRWMTYFTGLNAELAAAKEAGGDAAAIVTALTDQMTGFDALFVLIFTYSLAGVILLFGLWFGYRLVHWVTFADFLISVEAEMAKVSWPGKGEIRSSTIVVLVVFVFLAGILLLYDLVLLSALKAIGIQ